MRIKFLAAKTLVLALPLTLIPAFASSAPKITPGANCKVQKQKIDYQNKTYTCVKSGKRLIWNKGSIIVKKESASVPQLLPPLPPMSTTERKDWEYVYLKIWEEFDAAQNQGSFPFSYKLSPTVNVSKANENIAAYDKAMKLWIAILDGVEIKPINWTIMSEKDYSWWKEVVEQQEAPKPNYAWNPETNMLGHCQLSAKVFCGYSTKFQYNVIGSEYRDAPNANTVNHESVHLYQQSVVQGFPQDIPCWYVEGQASLYGGALQFNLSSQRNNSIAQRELFKNIVRQYQPEANTYTSKEWVTVLQNMYQPHISCSGQQDYFKYATGMFIWEYLYSNYGPKLMHQVLLDFKAGKLFAQATQDKFNLTVDQLNAKLSEHLVHVFARGN